MTAILDIEGTICPISFVKEKLYPYALEALAEKLNGQSFPLPDSSPLAGYLASFPPEHLTSPTQLLQHVTELTENDVKAPYWKALQGYLWKDGYDTGEITAPIFPDAIEFIQSSAPVVIYSSGSIAAQKLLFKYVEGHGDINSLISHYFDTTTAGSKLEASSYTKIEQTLDQTNLVFYSDNVKELHAAKQAGLQVVLVIRPNNAPVSEQDLKTYKSIRSFDELKSLS